jgi:hypothetical protein
LSRRFSAWLSRLAYWRSRAESVPPLKMFQVRATSAVASCRSYSKPSRLWPVAPRTWASTLGWNAPLRPATAERAERRFSMAPATDGLCSAAICMASCSLSGNWRTIETALTFSAGGTEPTMRT